MPEDEKEQEETKAWLGLTRQRRYKIYAWGALCIAIGAVLFSIWYLQPWRWYTYTDDIRVKQVARDVDPGYILWEEAEAVGEANASQDFIDQTVISSDGARMVYAGKAGEGNDTNLFLRLWDGSTWGESKPMRALNSKINIRIIHNHDTILATHFKRIWFHQFCTFCSNYLTSCS